MTRQRLNNNQLGLTSGNRSYNVTGTTGTATGNASLVTGSFNFVTGVNYLVIGNAQQASPLSAGAVWEVDVRVNGNNIATNRQEAPNGGQRGVAMIGMYNASSTGSLSVDLFVQRLTGSGNMAYEFPAVTIVPIF